LASAHQVDREYKVMKALDGLIPVPKMRALCDDPEVIGTSFYVMDYLAGRIFRDATLPGLTPKDRAEMTSRPSAWATTAAPATISSARSPAGPASTATPSPRASRPWTR
jgi:aminoglycoside phosphotransferase (APT) family kinase protein